MSASIGFNNPTRQLIKEAEMQFGTDIRISTILSIGSGRPALVTFDGRTPASNEPLDTEIYAAQKVFKTRENARNYVPLATAGDRIPNPDVKIKSFRIPRKDFKKYDSLGVPQHGSEGIPKTGITFADQKAGPNAWELKLDRYTYLAKQAVAGSYEEVRPWVNNLPDCALRQMKQHRKAYKKGRGLVSCTANTVGIAMAGGRTRQAEDAAPKSQSAVL
jgi:hypothetical protein